MDLQYTANPMEVEGELPDTDAEETANKPFHLVKSVPHHSRQGWCFLTFWEGFGRYKIVLVHGHHITVRCSCQLRGFVLCIVQQVKHYYKQEIVCGEQSELIDEENGAVNLHNTANPMEAEGELPDTDAEETANKPFHLVKSVPHHSRQGWRFLTL